jgi:uncharacterized membrane protein YphA (DoxX/SURF4 family)
LANALYLIGWIVLRLTIGYVYLYALYLNTHDKAARAWLVDHTAYLFPNVSQPLQTEMAKWFALGGMLMMLVGGLSILLGIEPRGGALVLLVFTAFGVYQHKREREVAMQVAARVQPLIPAAANADFSTVQWSAYSGQLSSGLKNWGLCGIFALLIGLPTGPWVLSDRLASLLK